ncbi:hypothetical protein [Camelimonas lactis]|uniref:Uncharacterized protein n=1 Tax=Camelimonas lactis TaxID=659006 RepID=A0A4R2GGS4_9HYPH|nr:hypothetical protein [Camelimonas lactis]TCO07536.1 hypothetical protein EV666_13217 [Camelimonas lactis]
MPATVTITEDHAVRIHELARRLDIIVEDLLSDMTDVVKTLPADLAAVAQREFERMPTLISLADESVCELLGLTRTIYGKF